MRSALRSQLATTILFAAAVAAIAVAFDSLLNHSWGPAGWTEFATWIEGLVSPAQRLIFLDRVQNWALPFALVATLTSFAVPALARYANPGVLLVYGAHHPGWGRVPLLGWLLGYFFGRMNHFTLALMGAVSLSTAAAALQLQHAVTARAPFLLTLGLLLLAVVWEFAVLLRFGFWALRMRIPGEVVAHISALAFSVVNEVGATGHLHLRPRGTGKTFNPRYDEQHELRHMITSLTQIGLITVRERQPFIVQDVLKTLEDLHRFVAFLAARGGLPREWFELWANQPTLWPNRPTLDPNPKREPEAVDPTNIVIDVWFDGLIVDAATAVIEQAVTVRAADAAARAGHLLLVVGMDVLATHPERLMDRDSGVFVRVLHDYANADEHGWRTGQLEIRQALHEQSMTLVRQLHASPVADAVRSYLEAEFDDLAAEMIRPAVSSRAAGLHQPLAFLAALAATDALRSRLVAVMLESLAAAQTLLQPATAAALYVALGELDQSGELQAAHVAELRSDAPPVYRPAGITDSDVRSAFVASAARGRALGRWAASSREQARSALVLVASGSNAITQAIGSAVQADPGASLPQVRWLEGLVNLLSGA